MAQKDTISDEKIISLEEEESFVCSIQKSRRSRRSRSMPSLSQKPPVRGDVPQLQNLLVSCLNPPLWLTDFDSDSNSDYPQLIRRGRGLSLSLSVSKSSSSQAVNEPGELTQLEEEILNIKEQTHTAERSVEQRNTSVEVNPEVIKSVEERKPYNQPPTVYDFTLLGKKDFLKSFQLKVEQAKAQGINVVGQHFQTANFAAAILDCQGGCLSIDDLDVHLYVPPGAIPVEQTQKVYIFVTGTSSVGEHSFLTPFVNCGPKGAVFDKDVVLTMPHCVKETSFCKFSLSKLSSGGSSEGLDVTTVVDNDSITFSVNRLCWFGAIASPVEGSILEKSMIACVFLREDSHSDEVTLRLLLVDGIIVNIQEATTEQSKYGFRLAYVESPLIVRKTDQDVVAKISNCSESWNISEPESCQLKFHREEIWRETTAGCAQGVIFGKRRKSSPKVPFKACMTVCQVGSECSNNGVTVLVDATQQKSGNGHGFASSLGNTWVIKKLPSRRTAKLGKEDSKSNNEHQSRPAKRSLENRNTKVDGNSEVIESVEESITYSQQPNLHDLTLLGKKDFLKSFEIMTEQAKSRGIDVVGQNFQIANFAAAILDCHGGCLSIDDLDVHLYVPPGAIPVEQTQQVYIFVTGTSSVDKHSFSTPFVHCGPEGAVFDKDVVLTMPHCVKETSFCKFSLSKLSSGGSSELSEGLDVITVVDNDSITFSVNHFCGFGATASPVEGTILKKFMIACLFIRKADDEVELRLRLVDHFEINVQEVENEEGKYGFHFADNRDILTVRKNDQDMVAKISSSIESWEITEPESCQRKFDHDLLWRETTASCAQAFPSVMFFAKRRLDLEKVCFKARMTVCQEGSTSSDYGVTLSVLAKQPYRSLPPVSDRDTQLERTGQMFIDQMARVQLTNVKSSMIGSRLLEESIFNKLCNLMDDPNPLGNDWRKLLNLLLKTDLGCSVSTKSIDAKAGREQRSPTEIVLDLFFGKQSGKTRDETMNTLKCALIDMNRPDAYFAIDAIKEQLIKWSDGGTGETQRLSPLFTPHAPIIKIKDGNTSLNTKISLKN